MTPAKLTVDASVWIAAADPSDVFHSESQRFLSAVGDGRARLIVPAFAVVEVACALARKLRDPVLANQLTQAMLPPSAVTYVPVDSPLLATALHRGSAAFLRGADALYAATAQLTGSTLVSWDRELIQRVGAVSPTDWLAANP